MYFEFCHQNQTQVSLPWLAKSHEKKCQNYFCVTTSPFAEMWLDAMLRKKGIKKKKKRWWILITVLFNEYIKQNIIMTELRKANFDSLDIWRLIKNQSCKKRSRKLIQTLIFSKLPSCTLGFKKKECRACYRIFFTLKNIT